MDDVVLQYKSDRATATAGRIQSAPGRIAQLDGIRGVAVSLVVLFHYFGGNDEQSIIANKAIRWVINRGWSGVDLFFILSGFLIGGILLDNKVNKRFAGVFYYRRFLRIFPLYYLLLLVAWLATNEASTRWWLYVAYLQNIPAAFDRPVPHILAITWSLAVEEHFYLLLPTLVALLNRRSLSFAVLSFVVAAIVLRIGAFAIGAPHADSFSYYFTFCRLDELMLGVGAALMVRSAVIGVRLRSAAWPFYIAIAVCLVFLPIISAADLKLFRGSTVTVGIIVYAVLYLALVLLAVEHPTSFVGVIFKSRILRWLGVRAYSIYLFHQTVLAAALIAIPATSIYTQYASRGLAIAMVLGLAFLLWKLVEGPLIALGHRLPYRSPLR